MQFAYIDILRAYARLLIDSVCCIARDIVANQRNHGAAVESGRGIRGHGLPQDTHACVEVVAAGEVPANQYGGRDVGGQAIKRVITPSWMTGESSTSCAVTSMRNKASGLFAA